MAEVKVLPVPEGSIIWLHDIDFLAPEDANGDAEAAGMAKALEMLRIAIPHQKFCVLNTNGGGHVEVIGPEELAGRVREALADLG